MWCGTLNVAAPLPTHSKIPLAPCDDLASETLDRSKEESARTVIVVSNLLPFAYLLQIRLFRSNCEMETERDRVWLWERYPFDQSLPHPPHPLLPTRCYGLAEMYEEGIL